MYSQGISTIKVLLSNPVPGLHCIFSAVVQFTNALFSLEHPLGCCVLGSISGLAQEYLELDQEKHYFGQNKKTNKKSQYVLMMGDRTKDPSKNSKQAWHINSSEYLCCDNAHDQNP